MKTHWRNLTNEKYLGAWDLEEDQKFKTVLVTIEKIFQDQLVGQMGKQMKSFIKFKEFQKSMVCNKTNFKRLEKRFNSFNISDFLNQSVMLTVEKVDSPEGKVDALRISQRIPPKQTVKKKEITNERLDDAIKAINDQENKMTKESFLKVYQLTEEQTIKITESC